ncbi:MAG: UPF0758 domain-containing protein [Desulfuromonadales bacterium]
MRQFFYKKWPASERSQEKLIHFGTGLLSATGLLAILLNVDDEGSSAIDCWIIAGPNGAGKTTLAMEYFSA